MGERERERELELVNVCVGAEGLVFGESSTEMMPELAFKG